MKKLLSSDEKGMAREAMQSEMPGYEFVLNKFLAATRNLVTFSDFSKFFSETGHTTGKCSAYVLGKYKTLDVNSWKAPGFPTEALEPVVCVNHEDILTYIDWVNKKLHQSKSIYRDFSFRLPSEDELEYIIKGGADSQRWWDFPARSDYANCKICQTSPALMPTIVGTFRPNKFGINDGLGNVWQLTQSCWTPTRTPQANTHQVTQECCKYYVIKGGSFSSDYWSIRAGVRSKMQPQMGANFIGFRLVLSVDKSQNGEK